ncbi:MAG: oligosaccharide flippase family protein [Candidatus Cloacimonetes bacterium]|jgi:O-antigen/teichoic acid export membrane protein|nr:oligosaccharide flippase family protein [Candidatus Cloacimonadota bacterium]MCK9333137.1 oligosaccharide flippase family protein [Candidatus Cloacimonadota bacterium]MDD4232631.1 oligosaccharide flippase family protein [Candidatus Cloacimonadota bacterium]MDD4686771.1 oligosaccharide flippase family protein [Candidatus Cloacimonadota bacterium]MDY0298751.1 oligosaccharide flippase family protein [Candidatus Cloacimonadaceae bacterium]
MSDLSRKAGLLSLADFIRFFIKTLLGIALARILSPADLGSYRQLFLIFSTLSGILLLGFPQSMLYFLPKAANEAEIKRIISRTFSIVSLLSLICALLIFLSSKYIANIFNNPSLYILLPLYSIYPIFMFVTQMYNSVLLGLRQTKKSAVYSIFAIACDFILVLGTALLFRDIYYIVWALLVSATIQWLWAYLDLRSLKLHWSPSIFSGFKEQLAYTIPLGVSLLIGVLGVQLDKLMISGFFKPEDFAVFSLGAMELPLIGILINSVNSVLLPHLSSGDVSALSSTFKASVRKNAIIIFPLATVFFIFAAEFMVFLYGSIYASSALYFRIYLLILPLRVATYGIVFQAMGKTRLVMIDSVIMIVLNTVLNYIFIRMYGMKGAAIATVLVSWLILLVYLWQMRFCLKIKLLSLFPPSSLLRNLLAALIPVVVVIPLAHLIHLSVLRMILGGCIYMFLYLVAARILKVIQPYDIQLVKEFASDVIKRKF